MDFRLNLEQEMLRDSARRYVSIEQSFERRRTRTRGSAHDGWSKFAEMGWLSLAVPEEAEGLGGGMDDLAILAEELGRGLTLEPFIGGAILPTRILDRSDKTEARYAALLALAGSELRVAVGLYESGHRYDVSAPDTRATRMPDGSYRLTGHKIVVQGGAAADRLLVSAQIDGGTQTGRGLAVFMVDAKSPGIGCRVYETIDEAELSDFTFDQVTIPATSLIAGPESALAIIEDSIDDAIVCLCAEALGCMDKAIELTAEFLKVRTQFGQPLAEFQVLQHAVAEMFIEVTNARSILYRAIAGLASSPMERRKSVSGCKIKIMEAAKLVTGNAIHLHGGIGMTCEYPVGHYLRRILVSERVYGDNEYHIERYISASAAESVGKERQ